MAETTKVSVGQALEKLRGTDTQRDAAHELKDAALSGQRSSLPKTD